MNRGANYEVKYYQKHWQDVLGRHKYLIFLLCTYIFSVRERLRNYLYC
jgi:hypothetical protein